MCIWILEEEIEWGNRYKGITQGNYFWHKNKYTHKIVRIYWTGLLFAT